MGSLPKAQNFCFARASSMRDSRNESVHRPRTKTSADHLKGRSACNASRRYGDVI
jgi:hypothetical protein